MSLRSAKACASRPQHGATDMQPFFSRLDPSYVPPDATPPLAAPGGLVVAVNDRGIVLALWTDAEHAAGRRPSLSEPVTVHEVSFGTPVQIGRPFA